MKQLIITLALLLQVLVASATILSFEDGKRDNISATNGQLSVTDQYAKLGSSSLQWQWSNGGVLSLSSDELTKVSTTKNGGVYFWVFNDKALSNEKMVVAFTSNDGTTHCTIDYNLNFTGWRMLQARFSDMNHKRSPFTTMELRMPTAVAGGTLCLDYVEFQQVVAWDRSSDMQFTVDQTPQVEDFVAEYNKAIPAVDATAEQQEAIATILQRIDEWFVWQGKSNANYDEMTTRKSAINAKITKAKNRLYPALDLTTRADGSIQGEGLFPLRQTKSSDKQKLNTFRAVSEDILLPLAYDARINNDATSAAYVKNILAWYSEQGWAAGSGLGFLRFEKLRSSGYFHTIFLMRNLLDEAELEAAIEAIHWYGLAGKTVAPYPYKGDNTDDIRTLLIAKLYNAVLQQEATDAVSAMESLRSYADNSFAVVANYADMIKPDYSGYHHRGVYMGAYFPDGLYAASLLCYFLHDTPFALSEETTYNLTQSLLNMAQIASIYDVPMAANGRFPTNTTRFHEMLPAIAYMALSVEDNSELLALLNKRWKPQHPAVSEFVATHTTDISHKNSLGEIGLLLTALEQCPKEKASEEPFAKFYPYAGMLIHRTPTHHTSVKGYNSYIWNFEASDTENAFGRYICYGQIEQTNLGNEQKNNAYAAKNFDWNLIPGATTKYVSEKDLRYSGGRLSRNFSDSEFLSGVAANGVSLFSLQLHDNTFDRTFYANKSVFAVGDTLFCLGSNITCDSDAPIQTTLFQQTWEENSSLALNKRTTYQEQLPITVDSPRLLCNQGNGYVVTEGSVKLEQDYDGTLIQAYITHGNAPTDDSYSYYILPQIKKKALQKFEAPMQVLSNNAAAHVVKVASKGALLAAIFEPEKAQNFEQLISVSKPVTLALFEGDKQLELVIADPDMQRATGAEIGDIATEDIYASANPTQVEVVLNGRYTLQDGDAIAVYKENKTYLTITLVNGMQQRVTFTL